MQNPNNIITKILKVANLAVDKIVLGINKIEGCEKAISRSTINKWKSKNYEKNESKNKKQKSIICFCRFLRLKIEEVYEILDYLGIDNSRQVDFIIHQIFDEQNSFMFDGTDSLSIVNFSQMLFENNLLDKTSIIIEDNKTKRILAFDDISSLKTNEDHYIRNISLNNLSIGCKHAVIEDIALKNIEFIIKIDHIDEVLSHNQYTGFNYYKPNSLSVVNLKRLCYLNEIDHILVYIKKKIDHKQCPIDIFLECMDKKLSIEKQHKLFESMKAISLYLVGNICNEEALKKLLYRLKLLLLNKTTDILVIIYIIETLGFLQHREYVKKFVWEVASDFFNLETDHPHIIWAFLITLQAQQKTNYSPNDYNLIVKLNRKLNEMHLDHSSYRDPLNYFIRKFNLKIYC
jgi:hypothetical protein